MQADPADLGGPLTDLGAACTFCMSAFEGHTYTLTLTFGLVAHVLGQGQGRELMRWRPSLSCLTPYLS